MPTLNVALLILSFVCFLLAAVGIPSVTKINLGWMGLALYVLTLLIK
jgi:hypothetical protein